jgi:hypothetical protein
MEKAARIKRCGKKFFPRGESVRIKPAWPRSRVLASHCSAAVLSSIATVKTSLSLLAVFCIFAGCKTFSHEQNDRAQIIRKQLEVETLGQEISVVLLDLARKRGSLAQRAHEHALTTGAPAEYSTESQCHDMDLTIKTLSECKRRLVAQLREFRRKHEIPMDELPE